MNFFTQLTNLPVYDNLYDELTRVMQERNLRWDKSNQICLNHVDENSDDVCLGSGSLTHDWDRRYTIKSKTGEERMVVPLRATAPHDRDFVHLCNQFKGTVFEEIYSVITSQYRIGRVRLMKSKSKTCLSWHDDNTRRIHYPIKTQEGCIMVIEDQVKHMPQNTWWLTDTLRMHTAINASLEDRIHLVAVQLLD